MAENKSNISLVDVYTQFNGSTEEVYKIEFAVTDTGGSAVTGLTVGNFSLTGSQTWPTFSDLGSGDYAFRPSSNFNPTSGSYLYAQVTKDTATSDKILVDFLEGYSASEATYSFVLPNETGNYKIELDKVNSEDFSTVESAQLRGNSDITTTNSKVQVYKSYLTHFAGETLSVKVTIGNGDSATLELSMRADKV
ncbi:hypothetical protein CLTEP_16470 [Clostridium tepidiprofundi DSM 19306]|uniref:Uncharacterized protein n=1 Tax=Clostridium tepidiprofundi DSM 19306 TaxID=1121338 RepID=A0A151B3B7_9CLOT|nr:hypothetical protein [Clostridium tepidiprofundi]KYH34414.1 hypothetical protein CLTEP_16470 [Clostridium tepidiprofundi DSM 19306]